MEENKRIFAKRQLCCQGRCQIEELDLGRMMIYPTPKCRKELADMWGYVTDQDCKKAKIIRPIVHARL